MINNTFTWIPPVDIYDIDNNYFVDAELPGVEQNDIKIEFSGSQLTIWGERRHRPVCAKENYHRIEAHRGQFKRSFTLPEPVNKNRMQWELKDGILHIVLPKAKSIKHSSPRGSR